MKAFFAALVFFFSGFFISHNSPAKVAITPTLTPSYNCEQVQNDEAKAYKSATPQPIANSENVFYFKNCITPTSPAVLTPTSVPILYNPHTGMKEIKGTNCSGQVHSNGKDINMDCQPYDYWVNPNAAIPTQDWNSIK